MEQGAKEKKDSKAKQGGAEFNPVDFIEELEGGYARCTNPSPYETLQSMTIKTHFSKEKGEIFKKTIKQMVLDKTLSPKFSKIILHAARLSDEE